jgi:3-methyladenine DNA glycosylase AlkD
MQAYMKSALPFLGIPAPERRRIVAAVVKARPLADVQTLAATMLALWQGATFREERYVASELARLPAHARLLSLSLLPVLETMIQSGAWWDHCDEISGNTLAHLLRRWPSEVKPVLRRWSRGSDLWLRRASFLCQRGLKGADFDAPLFYETLLPSIGDSPLAAPFAREFFIRKGIGWALRARSSAAPEEVIAFCDAYAAALAPLTVREALRAVRRRAVTTVAA